MKHPKKSFSPVGRVATDFAPRSYRTVVIDPPWPGPAEHRSQKGKGVTLIPYQTMTGIQLASMAVGEVATEDAQLWVWAPSRQLADAQSLMQLWGFSYAGLFIWQKHPNLGPWIRHDAEFLLRGVRRGAKPILPAPVQTHAWPRPKGHSVKPAEAYAMIEHYSPGPRLDIFARQPRPGFDAWGNQAPDALQLAVG
jgi:N6-adenosine-specific RNA methylase IME4